MPIATNHGVNIHYEVEGSGPPLVFHVGYMGRGQDSRRQDVWFVQVVYSPILSSAPVCVSTQLGRTSW